MDWSVIITSLLTACVPSAFAYFTATKQSQAKLKELESNFKNELEKIDKQHEHQIELLNVQFNQENKKNENEIVNNLATGVIKGDYDLESLIKLANQAKSFSNSSDKTKS
nr:MAG TPA: hypothetical protein [Bacteriophage sp.]